MLQGSEGGLCLSFSFTIIFIEALIAVTVV